MANYVMGYMILDDKIIGTTSTSLCVYVGCSDTPSAYDICYYPPIWEYLQLHWPFWEEQRRLVFCPRSFRQDFEKILGFYSP